MSRGSHWRRISRRAAVLAGLCLGTGCINVPLVVASAKGYADAAARYATAAALSGNCEAGKDFAKDAGSQAFAAREAADKAAEEARTADWTTSQQMFIKYEYEARTAAEKARVAAEAALSACGAAFDWSLDDPLEATYDEEESNQGGYTIPSGPPPVPGP
jgi:hypothetical protein